MYAFVLGTDTKAYNSVPTAIYCFLRGMQPIPGIPAEVSRAKDLAHMAYGFTLVSRCSCFLSATLLVLVLCAV